MNINYHDTATEDSDAVASDSELGPKSQAIQDLAIGAQSDENLRKLVDLAVPTGHRRKTKKGKLSTHV